MSDARRFVLDVSQWIREEVPAKAAEVQRMIVAESLTLIVQDTPVGNHTRWKANVERATKGLAPLPKGYVGGHARKNWQVSISTRTATEKPGTDNSGSVALNAGYTVIAGIKQPVIAYIANPLPYMDRLENGWSKQAPRGMVAQAVAAISAKYARVK